MALAAGDTLSKPPLPVLSPRPPEQVLISCTLWLHTALPIQPCTPIAPPPLVPPTSSPRPSPLELLSTASQYLMVPRQSQPSSRLLAQKPCGRGGGRGDGAGRHARFPSTPHLPSKLLLCPPHFPARSVHARESARGGVAAIFSPRPLLSVAGRPAQGNRTHGRLSPSCRTHPLLSYSPPCPPILSSLRPQPLFPTHGPPTSP